jgi:hypothetical protein
VPDESPEELLDRVIGFVTNEEFKRRRRDFYDYQIDLLKGGHKPALILRDLNRLVNDFNDQTLANDRKYRWETVVNVLAIAGTVASAWAAADFAGAAGALCSAGPVVWSTLQKRKGVNASGRIAAGAAMFHQIEVDTGFQFRTTNPHEHG